MRLILLLSAAVGLAALAPAPEAPTSSRAQTARVCFFTQQIDNFRAGDNQTLYIRSRNREVFELQTSGWCQELETSYRLAIVADGGSDRLCEGDRAAITVPGSPEQCRVQVARRLTAEEVEALPGRSRP